jgi:hypothetical protein
MEHENAKPPHHRRAPAREQGTSAGSSPLAQVEPPKMRVVSKGWSYRESLQTQEQVEAQTRE